MKKYIILLSFIFTFFCLCTISTSAATLTEGDCTYVVSPQFVNGSYNGLDVNTYSAVDYSPFKVISFNGDLYYLFEGGENGQTYNKVFLLSNIDYDVSRYLAFNGFSFGNTRCTLTLAGTTTIGGVITPISYSLSGEYQNSIYVNKSSFIYNSAYTDVSYFNLSISVNVEPNSYLLLRAFGVYASYDVDNPPISANISSTGYNYLCYNFNNEYLYRKVNHFIDLNTIMSDYNSLSSVLPFDTCYVGFGITNNNTHYYIYGDVEYSIDNDTIFYIDPIAYSTFNTQPNNYNLVKVDSINPVIGLEIYLDNSVYSLIQNNNLRSTIFYGDVNDALVNYLGQLNYNNGYNNGSTSNNKVAYDNGYRDGYNKGNTLTETIKADIYSEGYSDGEDFATQRVSDNYLNNIIPNIKLEEYNRGYSTGELAGFADGYESAVSEFTDPTGEEYLYIYNSGKKVGYGEGYEIGFAQGNANNTTLEGTISATIETIPNILTRILNFEIFGVNLLAFFGTIVFVSLVAIVIKKFVI